MSDQSTDDSDRFDCPHPFCVSVFGPEEMVAHLQWDHGYSEFKAKLRVEEECSAETDTDLPGDSDE